MSWQRLLTAPVIGALVALGLAVAGGGGAAGASTALTWNLAHDMATDYTDNPIADSYGNSGVWSYVGGSGGETSTYSLLDQYTDYTSCHLAVHAASGGFPLVGYHYADTDESCGTPTYPADSALVHPANGSDAAVRWTSPITGTVTLNADLTDEDANGGDGFTYYLSDDNGSFIDFAAVPNGGDSGPVTYTTNVQAGQSLYVVVGAGGGYDYDTTKLALTITGQPVAAKTVTLSTSLSQGKVTRAGTKVTLKVTLRAGRGDPVPTGTVSADGFTCRGLRDTTAAGKPTRAQATCTGVFPPGEHDSHVTYSGDGTYAPASTDVSFTVSAT